ncbi:hypothetical protein N474_17355 [Pseudoalteromonas luteoviolacea CPMOR-2]|uniref:DUF1826 domain-containing protein n=1 Tax=Pseudoalteromonas luteoviolacea DSM 6061 TaxID=1365250 RepID=A0A161XVQ3_9GAMM|nr:DUF1826 domain-containing protein [Pseudoalteromonas luteoviolacea]KZN36696.1 hypothetical protein N475_17370 [Pseudoalteromonas luteoviolacea DSM 6061]KZN54799.1 hypothetical protein N474_17355 [Pseudoalteromonas luteoviolacea CPMOR-2]MBE0390137.1 hypothetical protein [Pseudoalteromonas luteoviolacea DSM 6061]
MLDTSQTIEPLHGPKYLIDDVAGVFSNIYDSNTSLTCYCSPSSWAATQAAQSYVKKAHEEGFQYQGSISEELLKEIEAIFKDTSHGDLLYNHVALMVEMFQALFEPKEIGLRILPCMHSLSPAFHEQKGIVKMVSTIGGSGERWVERQFVKFAPLERHQISPTILQPKENDVNTLCDGDIALFKGKDWLDQEHNAVITASPAFGEQCAKLCVYIDYLS